MPDAIARGLGAQDSDVHLGINPDEYSVYLRTKDYQLIDRLDMWTQLDFIKKFNEVGTWNLEIPTPSRYARILDPTVGIIIQRNGRTIFSGPSGTDYVRTKRTIKTSGLCDNALLLSLARPTPSLAHGPYPDEYYVNTAQVSSLIRSLVNANIGSIAPPEYKIPQFSLGADPLIGSVATIRARFDSLLVLLKGVCATELAHGMGFEIIQFDDLSDLIYFRVYEPQDLHTSVIFSPELGTAIDYEFKHKNPPGNVVTVAGGDDLGIYRTIIEAEDPVSIDYIGRRIPIFVDKRGVTDIGELEAEAARQLATILMIDAFTFTVTDVASLRPFANYNVGDYVTAVIETNAYPRIVQEMEFTWDVKRGIIVKPTMADPFNTDDVTIVQHFNALSNRVAYLEQNYTVPEDSIRAALLHPSMKWYAGDYKFTARSTLQLGWLFCDGTVLLRASYPALFAAIGTTFGNGFGDGLTFTLPNYQDKFYIGAGGLHTIGDTGGSGTSSIGAHHHTHSHGLQNHTHAGQLHTHPGSHSHPISATHFHGLNAHNHNVVFSAVSSDKRNNDTVGAGGYAEPTASSGTTDHHHQLNFTVTSTSPVSTTVTTAVSAGTTDDDSNAPGATYSGSANAPTPNSSDPDSTDTTLGTVNIVPPFLAGSVIIFAGTI